MGLIFTLQCWANFLWFVFYWVYFPINQQIIINAFPPQWKLLPGKNSRSVLASFLPAISTNVFQSVGRSEKEHGLGYLPTNFKIIYIIYMVIKYIIIYIIYMVIIKTFGNKLLYINFSESFYKQKNKTTKFQLHFTSYIYCICFIIMIPFQWPFYKKKYFFKLKGTFCALVNSLKVLNSFYECCPL